MKSTRFFPSVRLRAIVTFFVMIAGPAGAQDGRDKVVVALGAAEGAPGSKFIVGVLVTAPKGADITLIEQDIRFENELLSYVGTEVTPHGIVAGVDVTASAQVDPEDRRYSILRLKATSKRPLSSGPVIGIEFGISDAAKPNTTTVLKNEARIGGAGKGDFSAVSRNEAQVTVTDKMPIFSCFFYMH